MRSTRRVSEDHNTGWFMFIPTSVWPFLIGTPGIFLIVGDVLAPARGANPIPGQNEAGTPPPAG